MRADEKGIVGAGRGVRAEHLLDCSTLRLPFGNGGGLIGIVLQPCLDAGAFGFRQLAVGIGMQVRFGHGRVGLAHFGLRSVITLSAFILSATRWRARDRRDITVPTGTPVMRATSS